MQKAMNRRYRPTILAYLIHDLFIPNAIHYHTKLKQLINEVLAIALIQIMEISNSK